MNKQARSIGVVVIAAVILALLFQPGCGKSKDQERIDRCLKAFAIGTDRERSVSVRTMVSLGQVALPVLLEKIKDRDLRRYEMAEALGEIGGPRAIDALIAALEDDDTLLCITAVKALSRHKSETITDALAGALDYDHKQVRHAVIEALQKIDSPKATRALGQALSDPVTENAVLARNILEKKGSPEAIEALINGLEDKRCKIRWHIISTLGKLKPPNPGALFKRFINDPEPNVRFVAMQEWSKNPTQDAEAVCLEKINDKDARVRARAAAALGSADSPRSLWTLRQLLSRERFPIARAGAVEGLAKLQSGETEEIIVRALEDDHHVVRKAAAAALAGRESPNVVAALMPLLDDENKDVQKQAKEVFETFTSPEAQEAAVNLLSYLQPDAREAGVKILGNFESPGTIAAFQTMLGSETIKHIRRKIIRALKTFKSPKAIEPLIFAALNDPDKYLRLEACQALSKFKSPRVIDTYAQIMRNGRELHQDSYNALAAHGSRKAEDALLEAVNSGGNSFFYALSALRKTKSVRVLKKLRDALLNEKLGKYQRENIMQNMIRIELPEAFDILFSAISIKDRETLFNLFRILKKFDRNRLRDKLCRALIDKRSPNRRRIAYYLRKFEGENVLNALAAALRDSNPDIHNEAKESLRRIGGKGRFIIKDYEISKKTGEKMVNEKVPGK